MSYRLLIANLLYNRHLGPQLRQALPKSFLRDASSVYWFYIKKGHIQKGQGRNTSSVAPDSSWSLIKVKMPDQYRIKTASQDEGD